MILLSSVGHWGLAEGTETPHNMSLARGSVCHSLSSETAECNLQLLCSHGRLTPLPQSLGCPQTSVWGGAQVPRAHLPFLPRHLPCLGSPIIPLSLLYKKRDFSWWSSFPTQKLESSRLPSYLLKFGTWVFRSQENSAFFSEQHVDTFPGELTAIVPSSQHAVLVSSLPTLHWPLKNSKLSASPGEWSSSCLPCMFLSTSGSPSSITLHCTECLAPRFLHL